MSRAQRLTFLGIAAVIAIVAVVILLSTGGGDDETEATSSQAQATATPTPTATAGDQAQATSTPEETDNEPPLPVLESGKVSKIEVKQGEQVAFAVHVTKPDTVHVHGYHIEEEVSPDKDTKISFKADITGIFDIELHSTDEQIAQLRVDPA